MTPKSVNLVDVDRRDLVGGRRRGVARNEAQAVATKPGSVNCGFGRNRRFTTMLAMGPFGKATTGLKSWQVGSDDGWAFRSPRSDWRRRQGAARGRPAATQGGLTTASSGSPDTSSSTCWSATRPSSGQLGHHKEPPRATALARLHTVVPRIPDQRRRADRAAGGPSNRTVAGYAVAARTKFEGRPLLRQAVLTSIALAGEAARRHWLRTLEENPDIDGLVDGLPEERMSLAARRFAAALYAENHRLLSHPLRTMGA